MALGRIPRFRTWVVFLAAFSLLGAACSSGEAGSSSESETASAKATTQTPTGQIRWERDFEVALKRARAEKKVLVADMYTNWCGWCKVMDKQTFADKGVVQFSSGQVYVKLNAEDRSTGTQIARRFSVFSFPTILVLDPEGRLVTRLRGFQRADQFIEGVSRAERSWRNSS